MTNLIMLFIIYGFLGWIVEVIYVRIGSGHWYNRGFLHMPFLPIYAFGAITITVGLQSFSSPLIVYILGVILTTILEYVTSVAMENLFHTKWWDYSQRRFNINGRVCLQNSLLFGVLSLVVIYGFNPLFESSINNLSPSIKNLIINVFATGLIIDLAYTLRNVSNLPVRDIRIISGKVKAYREGKIRELEELIEELEDFKLNDEKIRVDLKDYTHKITDRYNIHNHLIFAFIGIIIFGFIIRSLIISELLGLVVVIVFFIIIYNRSHRKGS